MKGLLIFFCVTSSLEPTSLKITHIGVRGILQHNFLSVFVVWRNRWKICFYLLILVLFGNFFNDGLVHRRLILSAYLIILCNMVKWVETQQVSGSKFNLVCVFLGNME